MLLRPSFDLNVPKYSGCSFKLHYAVYLNRLHGGYLVLHGIGVIVGEDTGFGQAFRGIL